MPHPPKNLTGIEFRSADGSDGLGKAGSVYARSVEQRGENLTMFPEARVVFEKLMRRRDEAEGGGHIVCPLFSGSISFS